MKNNAREIWKSLSYHASIAGEYEDGVYQNSTPQFSITCYEYVNASSSRDRVTLEQVLVALEESLTVMSQIYKIGIRKFASELDGVYCEIKISYALSIISKDIFELLMFESNISQRKEIIAKYRRFLELSCGILSGEESLFEK